MIVLMAALLSILGGIAPAYAQRLEFQLYDEDNGLSNATVQSMAQGRAGFLYAGTETGLYRYDGFRFSQMGTREGLPANGYVEAVRASGNGGIWVVFPDRVYRYGLGETVSAPLDSHMDEERAHRAAVQGNDLLLIRNHQLMRIRLLPDHSLSVQPAIVQDKPDHETNRPDPNRPDPNWAVLRAGVNTVHVEHDTIWLGCGAAICRLDDKGVVVLDASVGLPPDRWTALLRDHDGTLWLRSASRIASRAKDAARFVVIDVPGGPGRFANDGGQLDIVEDAAGHVVTQSAQGLLMYEHGRWITFGHTEGMPYPAVTTLLVDREGSLWFGSNNHGVARMTGPGLFENWTRGQGLSDDLVWNAARDGAGTLWVATDLAIDALAEHWALAEHGAPVEKAHEPAPDAGRRPAGSATMLHYRALGLARSAGGALWVGLRKGGLVRRDPITGQVRAVADLDLIRTILPDPAGSLWIGTDHGVARIDHPDDPLPTVSGSIPATGPVFDLVFDNAGELWVLSEKTLYHRDGLHRWHTVMQTDPGGGYMTRSMAFAPDGTLWLGSFTTGITRLHLDRGTVIARDRQLSTHLASQEVEMIRRDPAGLMWIGTDHGLDVTDGMRWRHLDEQDGLAANDINESAMFNDDDGSSWFGTAGGLSHLTVQHGLLDIGGPFVITRLHPMITGISVGDHEVSRTQLQTGLLHLQWSGDPLVISFASLDFRFEKSIRFRYRLLGVDRRWVETSAHEVRYPDPPWGRLVFEVMAVDPVHRLGSTPVSITIKVRPPWWRSWPVSAGGLLLVLGGLVLISRLRVSYLLVRQRQLEALVAERTHEIEQARLILFKQATFDPLTGLLTRAAILERLRLAMEAAVLADAPLVVALLDLDYFKKVNDEFGHLGGDAVLGEIGSRLSANIREEDQTGRYGGEELLLLLSGLKQDAQGRIEALRDAVFADAFHFEGNMIRMTCSIGVTWMRAGDDVTSMIRRADAALYTAKRGGRDRVVFDPPELPPAGSGKTA